MSKTTREIIETTSALLNGKLINEADVNNKGILNKPEGTETPDQEKVKKETPKVDDKENPDEVKTFAFKCKCNKTGVLNKPKETGEPNMQKPTVESSFDNIFNTLMNKLNESNEEQYVLGNDAGNIAVVDEDYIKNHDGTPRESDETHGTHTDDALMGKIVLPRGPGVYDIELTVGIASEKEEDYEEEDFEDNRRMRRGDVASKRTQFKSTSGVVYVGDLCYHFTGNDKAWNKIIDETDYLRNDNPSEGLIIVESPYGDGTFDVNVTIR